MLYFEIHIHFEAQYLTPSEGASHCKDKMPFFSPNVKGKLVLHSDGYKLKPNIPVTITVLLSFTFHFPYNLCTPINQTLPSMELS
ncbi:hypothetical protein VST7929_00968 [Vibrio stylophorae]|uniref:Uncharacterized protein n=1 Tax=Vibrio stylophorae TaxID=659351 RepID=A0ABN8DT69_9VIBR|nr:hypothetical protein VST7929_00968 [Vibrio stylophorae]